MKNRELISTGVGAVIFKDKDVLLIQRGKAPFKGQWSIPGGGLEYGETLHHAVHREVFEETSVKIEILDLLEVYEVLPSDHSNALMSPHYLMIDYICRWVSGSTRAGDDAADAKFFPIETALEMIGWDTTRTAVADAYKRYQNYTSQ